MEATLLLLVAGVGYVLSRRRHEPGRVPLTVPPVTTNAQVSQDARAIEACDRPSVRDQYHATRINDVLLAERREMAGREMAGREMAGREMAGRGGPSAHSNPYFHSSLSGVSTRAEHENMVPFFRGSEPPGSRHMSSTGNAGNGLLEGFAATLDVTGGESLSKGRREVRQLFEPGESRTNVLLRTPGVAAEYMDGLQRPKNRANELPFEQVRVGPIPEERMREMIPQERTIDELRPMSRPKAALEGRLIPGSSAATRTVRPNAGINTQSRPPPLVREQRLAEDFLGGGGVTQRPAYDKVNIVERATQRETTVVNSYRGGAAPVQVRMPENRGTEQRSLVFRTPLGELSRGPATTRVKAAGDYGRSAVGSLPSNGRTVAGSRAASLPGTLTTAVKALVAPVQDALRTTKKEEFVAPAEAANLVGAHGVPKLTVYDSQDVARTTLKETGLHDGRTGGMIAPTSRRGPVIDPDAGARRTLRESTGVNESGPRNLFRGGVGQGEAAPDAPSATLKDALAEDKRGGGGAFLGARAGAYAHAVLDPPAATQRATLTDSGSRFGGVGGGIREASGAYALGPSPEEIAATMRSTTLAEYFGASEGEVAQPASRDDVRSVQPALAREASVMTGREFLGGGAKLGAGAHEMGLETVPEDPLRDGAWRGDYMPPGGRGVGGGGGGGRGVGVAFAGVNTVEPEPEARYTIDRLVGDIEGHRVQGAGGALRPPQFSNDIMGGK